MPTKVLISPRESPAPARRPDPAAEHARALLRACDHSLEIADRDRPLSAPMEWARSGAMELTGPADGVPRFAAGALASAACGAGMVLGELAPGSPLSQFDAPALLAERAAIAELKRQGDVSPGGSARLFATRADHVVVNLPREEDWQLIPAWLEANGTHLTATRDWKTLAQLIARQDAKRLIERGRLMGLAVAPAPRTIPQNRPLFTMQHASEKSPGTGTGRRPIRLLDLSSLWAGPLATSLLALAGIQVLKIENPMRPDGARRGSEAFFRLLNGNKRICALDLHQPRDRALFERLLEGADIVVESARARALDQLGFDAASWVTGLPGRLWASITGYGRSREWIAFGDDAAIAAGLAWSPDPAQSEPSFCGDALADPLTGLTMAALLLAHSQNGHGGLLDLSLTDCAAHAAHLSNDGLVLPLESNSNGWSVVESGQISTIGKPRARTILRSMKTQVPPLIAPNEALIAEWTSPC